MQQLGAFHVLHLPQHAHELLHVVAVERPEVAYVHALKDVLLMRQRALQGVVEPYYSLAPVVVEIAFAVKPLRRLETQAIICLVDIEVYEIFLHSAHGTVYGHVVVVEDDKDVVWRRRHVVEALKGEASAHGAVAYHRHHVPVGVSSLLSRHGHAECRRDAVGGVAARERVVFALQRRGKRAYAAKLAVGEEAVAPARENLVAIGLVAHVPHYAVVGRVKHVMQRHGELYHAKTGGEVARVDRHFLDDVLPQLVAHLGQLLHAKLSQVGRVLQMA